MESKAVTIDETPGRQREEKPQHLTRGWKNNEGESGGMNTEEKS